MGVDHSIELLGEHHEHLDAGRKDGRARSLHRHQRHQLGKAIIAHVLEVAGDQAIVHEREHLGHVASEVVDALVLAHGLGSEVARPELLDHRLECVALALPVQRMLEALLERGDLSVGQHDGITRERKRSGSSPQPR